MVVMVVATAAPVPGAPPSSQRRVQVALPPWRAGVQTLCHGRPRAAQRRSAQHAPQPQPSAAQDVASQLYTSQPGISKQLKLLEEGLGLQLFAQRQESQSDYPRRRTGRQTRSTNHGGSRPDLLSCFRLLLGGGRHADDRCDQYAGALRAPRDTPRVAATVSNSPAQPSSAHV